jgi:two-component system chemotaxis sensor kinase CheA
MTTPDADFLKRLLAAFEVEAAEHLQAMTQGLLALESVSPDQRPALLETVYREAHSLKGAARAVNHGDIEMICQAIEGVFAAWKQQQQPSPSAEQFDALHRALDAIGAGLAAARAGPGAGQPVDLAAVIQKLKSFTGPRVTPAAATPPQVEPAVTVASSVTAGAELKLSATSAQVERSRPAEAPMLPETIRLPTARLDRLLLEAEEMVALKLTAAHRTDDVREIQATLAQWQKEWARISAAGRVVRQQVAPEQAAAQLAASRQLVEFIESGEHHLKALQGKVATLARSAQQDQRAISSMVDNLLEDTKKLVMLPFAMLLEILPKLVRDLARDQGKEVNLILHGQEVEVDKRILEELKDPLIHLVRNSLDHGLEKPEERQRYNKPLRGTVTVAVTRVDSSKVEILVADDGAGIDLAQVKQAAVKKGILTEEQARQLGEQEALALIFQSEVSTSPLITELSGRGLGLAIVREKVEKLGGRISLATRRHAGCAFHILLPTMMATFKGLLVEAAGQYFVLPTTHVEQVVRIPRDAIQTVENKETIVLDGRAVALARLDEVLELPRQESSAEVTGLIPVVVLGTGDKRIGFIVAGVLNEQEVLVKPLGRPLVRVRNVAGATVLGSGKAVLILRAADLILSAQKRPAPARAFAPVAGAAAPAKSKALLVVEDSITSRMLLKNILESAGYTVTTAVDGVEAWTALRAQEFEAVISDVEMPRMDGFELTAKLRADKKLAGLPVVLVTARESREDRERGIDVGANAYIVKSSFDQSNLLEVLQRLV